MDNVKEAWAYITYIKNDYIFETYTTFINNKDAIVDKVEEPRATSVSNRPNGITKWEKNDKIRRSNYFPGQFRFSVLSELGASLAIITPDQKLIPIKTRERKTTSFNSNKGTNTGNIQPQKNISRGFSYAFRESKSKTNLSATLT